jgi:formylglycine-generating enzyme required for sulfatase activity
MGSDPNVDRLAQGNEQPAHQVCLTQGYWIDQYEVTNAAYQKFVAAGGYSNRAYWPDDKGWSWSQDPNGGAKRPAPYQDFLNTGQPRVGVSWYEANAYALWSGCHLPTEAQWEYAARGPQSLVYPWGNQYDQSKGNINTGARTKDVGSFPGDKSWVNAFDMGGNAWEWAADWYDRSYYGSFVKDDPPGPTSGERHTIRGGVWKFGPQVARSAVRNPNYSSDYRDANIGFRIVCSQ